ncbi:MAG: RidA family protein [Paracoccaceae bacterium]
MRRPFPPTLTPLPRQRVRSIAYLTGQTATDRTQDVQGQTREVLAKIDRLLAIAGTDRTKILFAQVWLKHCVKDFADMNTVWDDPEHLPARATVEANLAHESILVEIAVQARID